MSRRPASSRGRPDVGRGLRRRRFWVVALVAFLAIDVVLVAWAFSAVKSDPVADVPMPSPPPLASAEPSPSPSVEPEPEPPVMPTVVQSRVLAAWTADVAWRATTGPCPATPALPELTRDGGATWAATDATTPTGTVAVQSIRPEGDAVVSMVTLTAEGCSPAFVRSYVSGDNYGVYPDELPGMWFVDPTDRSVLHAPAVGTVAVPCDSVITVAPADASSAAVLCSDQTVAVTSDSGASWGPRVEVPGAQTVAAVAGGFTVAAVGAPACAGVQLSVLAGGGVEESGCVVVDVAPESLVGEVAVSEAAGTIWVWAGAALVRSSDGGVSWV